MVIHGASDWVRQIHVSLAESIMTAHPSHALESHFYGLHCNLLQRPWVNHSFLLGGGGKEDELIFSTIKIL